MSNKRIYHIKVSGGAEFLVRASSKSQAINAVAQDYLRGTVATQETLVSILSHGGKVREVADFIPVKDEDK